jgi:ankyrin repeat protein
MFTVLIVYGHLAYLTEDREVSASRFFMAVLYNNDQSFQNLDEFLRKDPTLINTVSTYSKSSEETALHVAVLNGSREDVEYLLSKGANVNKRNEKGVRALKYAMLYNNNGEIAEVLKKHGARE